jgi:hypothetical protein
MNEDYIEHLREAANTKIEVCFGEQSIKRKRQLHDYYRDKLISYNKNSYMENIYSSVRSIISFIRDITISSISKKE